MTQPTYAVGEVIAAGTTFRFVPNWEGYWEYDRNRPSPRAFRRDSDDDGVSAYLEGAVTQPELEERQAEFAICGLDIEELAKEGMQVHLRGLGRR